MTHHWKQDRNGEWWCPTCDTDAWCCTQAFTFDEDQTQTKEQTK